MPGGHHPAAGVMQGHPRPHDAGRPGPSVCLQDVTVERYLLLSQAGRVGDGPEAAPDETLYLLRTTRLPPPGCFLG